MNEIVQLKEKTEEKKHIESRLKKARQEEKQLKNKKSQEDHYIESLENTVLVLQAGLRQRPGRRTCGLPRRSARTYQLRGRDRHAPRQCRAAGVPEQVG